MSASVAEHPTLRRWLRLLAEVDALPGDPPALSGLDDLDPEVLTELLPARARDTTEEARRG